ncbi:antirepressor [Gordonia phage YungMoney]|nr:antirepressor [Gordonia phage YungMoney]
MINDMAPAMFTYSDQPVRVVTVDGEPWFVLADLCKVLEIANVGNVADRLDELNIRRADVENSRGQMRLTMIVNEAGMYEVVIRSDKPEAVSFRRWITGTVLPEIRRTGSFNAQPAVNGADLTRMDLIQLAMNAETERLALEAKNAELEPKADAYDSFIDATGKFNVGAVAKMLGTSQNKLFRDLRNAGVLIGKGAMRNTPYQQYMHHFEVKAHEYERSNGEIGCSYTTYVQPSGIDFIRRKLDLPTIDPVIGGVDA